VLEFLKASPCGRWLARGRLIKRMNIKPKDLVLEVGSGNNPNPRSDILVDRYPFDNGQRAGGFRIVIDRPLVVADGYKLPFADKIFDYVICSHILEHMKDPMKFIAEIMRVGKAGYIEVPSDLSERIFGWNFHLWYCRLYKGRLELKKKKEGEQFGGFFHRLIARQIWFRRFFEEHEEKFYVKYEWNNKVKLSVSRVMPAKKFLDRLDSEAWKLLAQAKQDVSKDIIFYFFWMKRRGERKIKKIIRRLLWTMKKIIGAHHIVESFFSLFSCPMCSSDNFLRIGNNITCNNCHTTFPLVDVIPVMLAPKERKRGW